jgi:hypothetical protein
MGCTVGLLAVGCVLAMSCPAGADLTTKNSADFDWKYEMDLKPSGVDLDTNGTMDFTEYYGPAADPVDGILTLDTSSSYLAKNTFVSQDPNELWAVQDFTFEAGYTFEVSTQVISQTGGDPPYGTILFLVSPGSTHYACLNLWPTGQSWGYDLVDIGEQLDNSDAFHAFRVAQFPNENKFNVWRDNVLIAEEIAGHEYASSGDRFYFGDSGSHYGGEVDIDYLRIHEGAWAPDYTPPPDPIPGDANEDDVVNDEDASILAAHWQQSGEGIGWGDGDFNDDGVVDDQDASILAAHWLETREGTAPIPEPSVLVLLGGIGLLGLVGLARRRR